MLLLNGKTIHVASVKGVVVFYETGKKPAGAKDIIIKGMDHDGDNNVHAAITITFKDATLREQSSVVYNFHRLDPIVAAQEVEHAKLITYVATLTRIVEAPLPPREFMTHD